MRLPPSEPVPSWVFEQEFFSVTRTSDEFSLVCPEIAVPSHLQAEEGWKAFKVAGPLDFGLTGILASLSAPLAEAKISIFAISTYDTDYILVKKDKVDQAVEVLAKFCIVEQ